MTGRQTLPSGNGMMSEMKEFASFPASTQRYIRRSLDVGLDREDAVVRWSRDVGESAGIRAQMRLYVRLDEIRDAVPRKVGFDSIEAMMGGLVLVSAFDLGQGRLPTFSSYRFLYERLLGAAARPWLPSAFCGSAAIPTIPADLRRSMLQSISEAAATAAGWSTREPSFFPHWVEKVEVPKAA